MPINNSRHRERLARQVPRAWKGEAAEDAAVFDDAAFNSLSAELAEHVSAVREAIKLASDSRTEAALQCVSTIPRSSALSEW